MSDHSTAIPWWRRHFDVAGVGLWAVFTFALLIGNFWMVAAYLAGVLASDIDHWRNGSKAQS